MRNIFKIVHAWLPPIAWMCFIFYLSSHHKVQVSPNNTINFIVFKSLHVIEYAILYFLLFRAMYMSNHKKISPTIYLVPAIITLLYASSDEFHQTFTPTRTGRIRDIFIDAIGVTIMYGYLKTHLLLVKKFFT